MQLARLLGNEKGKPAAKASGSPNLKTTEKKTDHGEIHLGRHVRQDWGTSKSHSALGYEVPLRQEGQRGRVFQKQIAETDPSADKRGGQAAMC